MLAAAQAFDAANNRDNVPPLVSALSDELGAWRDYRAVHCAVDLSGEYIVTGVEEASAYCRAKSARSRIKELIDRTTFFRDYVRDFPL